MPSNESSESTPKDSKIQPEASKGTADTGAGPIATPEEGAKPNETGGPKGLEPTRYGDWEQKGRCIDF